MSSQKGLSAVILPHLDARIVQTMSDSVRDPRSGLYTINMKTVSGVPLVLVVNRAYARSFMANKPEIDVKQDDDPNDEQEQPITTSSTDQSSPETQPEPEQMEMQVFSAVVPGDDFTRTFREPKHLFPGWVNVGDTKICIVVDKITHELMTESVERAYHFYCYTGDDQIGAGVVGLAMHAMIVDQETNTYEPSKTKKDSKRMARKLAKSSRRYLQRFLRMEGPPGDANHPEAYAQNLTEDDSETEELIDESESASEELDE